MSYDLYFKYRTQQPLLPKEFKDYFEDRPYYRLEESEAVYENTNTGVNFSFTYSEEAMDEEDEPDTDSVQMAPVSFNINYFRPHVFALEAAFEIQAFVTHFDIDVSDPQTNGMGDGAYSREGFLSGWNYGNQFAVSAILKRNSDASFYTLPTEKLENAWKWNFAKAVLQEQLGDSVFAPAIMPALVAGKVKTIAVWPEAIPTQLPEVDYLFIHKGRYSPKKWIFFSTNEYVLVPFEQIKPLLAAFERIEGPVASYNLAYDEPPALLTNFVTQAKGETKELSRLETYEVLNEELVSEYKTA